MNPGGIRTNLTFLSSGSEADGEVTFAEVFAVERFVPAPAQADLETQQLVPRAVARLRVDGHRDAGDKARGIAGQERCNFRHLFRPTKAAQRME